MEAARNWRVGSGQSFGRFIAPTRPDTWFIAHEGMFVTTEQPGHEVSCALTDAVFARAAQKPAGSSGPGVEFCSSTLDVPKVVWDGTTLRCES
jgi:hypothetical protein